MPIATDLRLALDGEVPSSQALSISSGVGLIRGEYVFRVPNAYVTQPSAVEFLERYTRGIATLCHPRPVWYRLHDLETRGVSALPGADHHIAEDNPRLGLHGLRRGLRFPEALEAEITAVARAAVDCPNLHMFFPFVGQPSELRQAVTIARACGFPNRLGTMIELPLAAINVEEMCDVDGITQITIGTNDLTTMLLGVERDSPLWDKTNPQVVRFLTSVVRRARARDVETSLAGDFTPEQVVAMRTVGADHLVVHYHQLSTLTRLRPSDLGPDLHLHRELHAASRREMRRSEIAAARQRLTPRITRQLVT